MMIDCYLVENYYHSCLQLGYRSNKFVTNCDRFETSISAPLTGIQCDSSQVIGHSHNYTKSRGLSTNILLNQTYECAGNIVNTMMFTFTKNFRLLNGLWCESSSNCDYRRGGMFTTTTLKKVLFQGFTEPSVLQYYNLKYSSYLTYACVDDAVDHCGTESFVCSDSGVYIQTKNSTGQIVYKHLIKYGSTSHDEYFAPYFQITSAGEMLWLYSMNSTKATRAAKVLALYNDLEYLKSRLNDSSSNVTIALIDELIATYPDYIPYINFTIVKIINPMWTAYPSWNVSSSVSAISTTDGNVLFQKYYQCQHRMYSGLPSLFSSCYDELFTGRDDIGKTLQLHKFRGNATLTYFTNNDRSHVTVNGTSQRNLYRPYAWSGFISYPYSYRGITAGPNYGAQTSMTYFDKLHALPIEFSQKSLVYSFQKDKTISFPITDTFRRVNQSTGTSLSVRRFTESTYTWDNLRALGTPTDSYGMNYTIPIGMASLERFADLPLYIGTAHCYGNELWGGSEYSMVSGYSPDQEAQQTYMDYDPVSGYSVRHTIRQQIHLRLEANALFPLVFQAQRCTPPTKLYSAETGYGCFAYIPLLWFEDTRMMSDDEFQKLYYHYYTRPERAYRLTIVGVVIGCCLLFLGSCILISESYFRRRFKNRIYVD